jgi:hypothetical protein
VFRIITAITEIVEQRITYWSLLITAALALAGVAGRAHGRCRARGPDGHEVGPLPEPIRALRRRRRVGSDPDLRRGFVVLKVRDTNADTLIDVVTIVRAAQVLVLIGVLLAGLAAVREAERSEAGLAARGAG